VVAIHGDYDPHPAEGVQKPLSAILENFRFILLKNCGHKPWVERQARDRFYAVLKVELSKKWGTLFKNFKNIVRGVTSYILNIVL
jgi:pimeloyl-ACP methyl ester carboxylesterase